MRGLASTLRRVEAEERDFAADESNAEYWDMLCGWALAQQVEMTGDELEDLRRFDDAYLAYYPYLREYVDPPTLRDKDVLEIGLGYGTLGQVLALTGARYVGVDVAREPVELLQRRIAGLGDRVSARSIRGSALSLPFEDESFDYVYSIGCLHHTGNLSRAVEEVHRVLRPQGTAIVMVYNGRSIRHLGQWIRRVVVPRWRSSTATFSSTYDADRSGAAPPHTDFVDRHDVRRLFAGFSPVSIDVRNFPDWSLLGRFLVKREWFLDNLARKIGLDLYITAVK
jgi:SAM-dependent methyltransferase